MGLLPVPTAPPLEHAITLIDSFVRDSSFICIRRKIINERINYNEIIKTSN